MDLKQTQHLYDLQNGLSIATEKWTILSLGLLPFGQSYGGKLKGTPILIAMLLEKIE